MLSLFPYVKLTAFTQDIEGTTTNLLTLNSKDKTAAHVKAVADTCVIIARQYGLDEDVARICGYLHDISAVISPTDMLSYAKEKGMYIDESENRYPFILHQRISRLIAMQDFKITDERILSAIECHSTLKADYNEYDMTLFIADKLSWDQDGLPPFYDDVKQALDTSLEAASLAYMQYIMEHKLILYPHSWFNQGMEELLLHTGVERNS